MEENYNGKIKFYDDEINVLFPSDYEKFKEKLGEMLGLTSEFLNNLILSYKDEGEDKILINNDEDYRLFIEEIKKDNMLKELLVEVKEKSSLLIKKVSSSIINYVSKNSGNINNLSEDIKEKHKSLELSDEISQKNISKELEKVELKEEKEEKEQNEIKEEIINNNKDEDKNIIINNIDNNNKINIENINNNNINNDNKNINNIIKRNDIEIESNTDTINQNFNKINISNSFIK